MRSNLAKASTGVPIDLPNEKKFFCDHCEEPIDDLHDAVSVRGAGDPRYHLNRHYLHRGLCIEMYNPHGYREWTARPLDDFLASQAEEERKISAGIRKRFEGPVNPGSKFKSPSKPIELPEHMVNADTLTN